MTTTEQGFIFYVRPIDTILKLKELLYEKEGLEYNDELRIERMTKEDWNRGLNKCPPKAQCANPRVPE